MNVKTLNYIRKKILILVSVSLNIYGCSFNSISSQVENEIYILNNNKNLVINSNKINEGEVIKKKDLLKYIPALNIGSKWQYQTTYKFSNKNFRSNSFNKDESVKKIIDGKPLYALFEVKSIEKNNNYVKMELNYIQIFLDKMFTLKVSSYNLLPLTRLSHSFAFVWLTTGKLIGIDDNKYDEIIENLIRNQDNFKYIFKGTQNVFVNNKAYLGYRFYYSLNNIFKDANYQECKIKATGESIFVKGIGIIRDQTDISLNYLYQKRETDNTIINYIPQELNYIALSELSNFTLK